jgi:hypothetical protein
MEEEENMHIAPCLGNCIDRHDPLAVIRAVFTLYRIPIYRKQNVTEGSAVEEDFRTTPLINTVDTFYK